MYNVNVKLTFVQMYYLGIHLGHTMPVSKFLSFGIYGGGRSNLFIINLVKTRIQLKNVIDMVEGVTFCCRPIGFINLDRQKGSYINRYAILSGEPSVSYYGIDGTLTNFVSIFSGYNILYKLVGSAKYKMRHRDKNKLLNYFGFLNHRSNLPGLGFVTSTLASGKAVNEFGSLTLPCAAVVDSNILSGNISLPIPGNDDSLVCLNYYCFIVARGILFGKCGNLATFKNMIRDNGLDKVNVVNLNKKMMIMYFYKRRNQKVVNKVRRRLISKYSNDTKLFDINGSYKNMMFDMKIFNTEYSAFSNLRFSDSLIASYSTFFESNKDLIFYNDPYRIY